VRAGASGIDCAFLVGWWPGRRVALSTGFMKRENTRGMVGGMLGALFTSVEMNLPVLPDITGNFQARGKSLLNEPL